MRSLVLASRRRSLHAHVQPGRGWHVDWRRSIRRVVTIRIERVIVGRADGAAGVHVPPAAGAEETTVTGHRRRRGGYPVLRGEHADEGGGGAVPAVGGGERGAGGWRCGGWGRGGVVWGGRDAVRAT